MTAGNWIESWQLEFGGKVIARIVVSSYEFPWFYGTLTEGVGFERFRKYFGDEDLWPQAPEFEALLTEIQDQGGFTLRSNSGGRAYKSFRLNHDGADGVWFRHADK